MSYTLTNWQTGDTITAERLNKLENGVAALSNYDIVFTVTDDELTADGASFDELISGGYKKALFNNSMESITFTAIQGTGKDPAQVEFIFCYIDPTLEYMRFVIDEDGHFAMGENNGTYTYSNGHYVFTREEIQ